MPVLDIEIVIGTEEQLPIDLAQRIAHRAGEIFNTPAGHTWVMVHRMERGLYAENDVALDEGVKPVLVRVLKARMPPEEQLLDEVQLLTLALAQLLNRPFENIHIIYEPEARGRVAFGGRLVE